MKIIQFFYVLLFGVLCGFKYAKEPAILQWVHRPTAKNERNRCEVAMYDTYKRLPLEADIKCVVK